MPRAKRSKDNRKLMDKFSMNFGFRKPYQVLMDADFVLEGTRCKMEIVKRLEDNLHARGDVKPMITQCSMRHLYARKSEGGAGVEAAIDEAKNNYERRRCGHHPDQYPEPLSAFECIRSVVDPKGSGLNKHRYVCAVNDDELRASLREVAGVPLLYIRRSVMTLEPMAEVSTRARSKEERAKFRAEIKRVVGDKRKRADDRDGDDDDDSEEEGGKSVKTEGEADPEAKKRKKSYGQKQPNPLSAKKKQLQQSGPGIASGSVTKTKPQASAQQPQSEGGDEEAAKKKRKRKTKKSSVTGDAAGGAATAAEENGAAVEAAA
ncbi:U3 small nucleolar RNA-associated protein 23 [Microdochium nivale]|nr:U3 small nucleolar RNA-associated protein 23 [Microdochium nivale]